MAHVTVAVFVTDDDRVSDFAATFDSGKLAAKGCGAATLAAFAKVALASKWSVTSLGGLDAMRRAAAEMEGAPSQSLKQLAARHSDAAYDFLVDNGFALTWLSVFPKVPDTAEEAAAMIATCVKSAQLTGVLTRQTVAGKTVHWPLVTYDGGKPRFRTVDEARRVYIQSPPDQSWMTSNIPDIAAETAWLG